VVSLLAKGRLEGFQSPRFNLLQLSLRIGEKQKIRNTTRREDPPKLTQYRSNLPWPFLEPLMMSDEIHDKMPTK
jgi:hypothetical protein